MKVLPMLVQSLLLIVITVLLVRLWPLTNNLAKSDHHPDEKSVFVDSPVSDQIKHEISAIEAKLANETSWPRSAQDVQLLHDQLARVVNSLPPRAQEDLLPRLVPRRWEIQALWLLANEPHDKVDVEGLNSYAEELDSLATNKPLESSDKLRDDLKKIQKEVQGRVVKQEEKSALKEADDAINGKASFDKALRRISGYETSEARKMAYLLVLGRDLDAVSEDMKKYEQLKDLSLKEYAFVRLNQAAMELRLRTNVSTYETPKNWNDKLGVLEKKIAVGLDGSAKQRRADSAKKSKGYQIWALNQIKSIPTYEALEEAEINQISSVIDRNSPLSNARKIAINSAHKKLTAWLKYRMAPINPAFLDEAVAQWYRKVFQNRFDKLTEGEQLEVVQGFAETEKKFPE